MRSARGYNFGSTEHPDFPEILGIFTGKRKLTR
jgi:hypothetical protein